MPILFAFCPTKSFFLNRVLIPVEPRDGPQYSWNLYLLVTFLQGAYGMVVEAEDLEGEEDPGGKKPSVAIKKLPRIFCHPAQTKSALREILVLQQFDHPNILGVIDVIVPLMEREGKVCMLS